MLKGLRFGLVAMMIGAAALTFLGAVSFQNGDAMSTLHQQGVLKSLHTELMDDLAKAPTLLPDRRNALREHPLLTSPDLTAMLLDRSGNILSASWTGQPPEHARQIVRRRQERGESRLFENRIDMETARFVWVEKDLAPDGPTFLLVHRSENMTLADIAELYVLPVGLGILMIVWLGFWASVMAARLIRHRESEDHLKGELVRQEQANRIRSAFFANMSHELRTPLNAILGFSEMLKREILGPLGHAQYRHYATDIHQSGSKLLNLITNLLHISDIQAGGADLNEQVINVHDLISTCLGKFASDTAARQIQFSQNAGAISDGLLGDRIRLEQALNCLISNAVKFSPDGGAIRVEARLDRLNRICLEVRDNGCGIQAEQIARIFGNIGKVDEDPYRTQPGLGLGLMLCRSLIELHDGTIQILSDVGIGTTALITFPAARTLARRSQPKAEGSAVA